MKEIIQGSSRTLNIQIRRGASYLDFTGLNDLTVVLVNNNTGTEVSVGPEDCDRRTAALRVFVRPEWTAATGRYRLILTFTLGVEHIVLDPFVFTVIRSRPNDITGFSKAGFGLEIEYVMSVDAPPAAAGDAGVKTYTHVQSAPADVWTVRHNFGTPLPVAVFVQDAAGELAACETDCPASTAHALVLRFGTPTQGRATVWQPAEAGTDVRYYTHLQSAPADTWLLQHNLGTAAPAAVFVRDADGELVTCETDLAASTANLLVLRFGQPETGMAMIWVL